MAECERRHLVRRICVEMEGGLNVTSQKRLAFFDTQDSDPDLVAIDNTVFELNALEVAIERIFKIRWDYGMAEGSDTK